MPIAVTVPPTSNTSLSSSSIVVRVGVQLTAADQVPLLLLKRYVFARASPTTKSPNVVMPAASAVATVRAHMGGFDQTAPFHSSTCDSAGSNAGSASAGTQRNRARKLVKLPNAVLPVIDQRRCTAWPV